MINLPLIGLGTWELRGKSAYDVISMGLEIGYRHIDTAFAYENHKEIGKAINGFDREKLFITTKMSLDKTTKTIVMNQIDDARIDETVEDACDLALRELEIDYLDLFLIHYPVRDRPMEAVLSGMHKLKEKGKIRFAGVSNYTTHHMQNAFDANLPIDYNQVEFHPYLYQKELLRFCNQHQTGLISFRPFGKGKLLKEEPLFTEIGERYGKTAAQVVLRWIIQKKIPVIPKASSRAHLEENFNIFDFQLSKEHELELDMLNKNFRYCENEWAEFDY